MKPQGDRIRELYHQRPRSWSLRVSFVATICLIAVTWWQLEVDWSSLFSERRIENLRRFAGDVYPFKLREQPFSFGAMWEWGSRIWRERGCEALQATVGISVVAIILAGTWSLLLVLPGARNIATPEPLLPSGRPPTRGKRWAWSTVVFVTRGAFIFARSIPEYVWAFLLIALIGPSAWPAILALAIHNFGILGKLGSEVVENLDTSAAGALRGAGLSRRQIAAVSLFPAALPKWLLFFFYRWETCIREATVLGMLGISSLGYHIMDTRARDWYDEMLLFILLGAALVLVVDLLSALTRRYIRRA